MYFFRKKKASVGLIFILLLNLLTVNIGILTQESVKAVTISDNSYTNSFEVYPPLGWVADGQAFQRSSNTAYKDGTYSLKLYTPGSTASDDSPGSLYLPINATGKKNITVSFYTKKPSSGLPNNTTTFQVSYDNGANYEILYTFSADEPISFDDTPRIFFLDLTAKTETQKSQMRVRFRSGANNNNGYWVDAMTITADGSDPGPTPTPVPTTAPRPTPEVPVLIGDTKLSLNKPATASSENEAGSVAGNACDPDTTTSRWAGANYLTGGSTSDWWKVDLGRVETLSEVDIHWYNSVGSPRAYKYIIEVSDDDQTYSKVVDRTTNTTQDNTQDILPTGQKGRYVRITITGQTSSVTTIKASIYDVSVYGIGDTCVSSPVINSRDADNLSSVFASAYSIQADTIIANYRSPDDLNAALMVALYDNNGTMKDIACTYGSVYAEVKTISAALNYSQAIPQGYYARAYIWDNLSGMKPYADSKLANDTTEFTQTSTDTSTDPNISTSDGIVTVKGKAQPGERVTLEVLKPNKTVNDISANISTQGIKEVISYLYQAAADASGYYSFRFSIDTRTGTYSARLGGQSFSLAPISFIYISPQDVAEAIAAFNTNEGNNDLNRMREKVEQYRIPLELKYDLFDGVVNKDAVYQKLINGRSSQGYQTKQQIIDVFNEAVIVQAAKEASEVQRMGLVLNNYYGLLPDTNKYLGIYKDMSSTYKGGVANAFIEVRKSAVFDSVPEMAVPFSKAVAIGIFNSAESWGEIDSAVADTDKNMNDVLLMSSTDLAAYNQLPQKNKTNICKDMIGNSFTSTEAISQRFTVLLAAEIKAINDAGQQGGSRNSSSGSGKTTSTIKSSSSTVIDNRPIVQPKRFADLAGFEWAEESIDRLASRGVIDGQGNNLFKPEEKVTREQFLKMLIIGFKIVDEAATSQFSDISTDGWYYKYVATAEKLGLTQGTGDRSFGLGSEISRQEMAVMAYRVASYVNEELKAVDSPQLFDDNEQIDDYAQEAVSKMQQAKIIMGVEGNVFEPKTAANRAQAAVIIERLLKLKDTQQNNQ